MIRAFRGAFILIYSGLGWKNEEREEGREGGEDGIRWEEEREKEGKGEGGR